MFELTWEEQEQVLQEKRVGFSRPQNVTLRCGTNAKYTFLAFTEQGVAMLSSVPRSGNAVRVSIATIRVFVRMRQIPSEKAELARRLAVVEQKLANHDRQILSVVEAIRQLADPGPVPPRRRIGFNTAHEG